MPDFPPVSRRRSLGHLAAFAAAAFAGLRSARGATLERTPSQSEGPFYPVEKPADPGPDLIHTAGARADGDPLRLAGRVLDTAGRAVAGARVEIWQCDQRGAYRHPRSNAGDRRDPHFKGYGETLTSGDGGYAFLTIVPVPYTGRPPHIHAKVWAGDAYVLTTQIYLAGHPGNARDGLLGFLRPDKSRALMIAPRAGEASPGLAGFDASFDFVV